ncbi:QRFP-like peptide receptor [Oculina patagonica]
MSLTSNTTILTNANETTLGQQNSTSCIFVSSTAETISRVCAYCVILLISLLENTFIIIIVYKHRDLRKTVNYFIVNMAVSDLVFSLVLIPLQITRLVTGSSHWAVSGVLGAIFCKLYHFLRPVSLQVSAQSLVWIAIDRFVAVVFSIKLGLISTKIRTAAIISTWIVAGLFNFPKLIITGLDEHGNKRYCSGVKKELIFPNQESIAARVWCKAVFFRIVPLFLTTVLYTAIAIVLKKQNKALADTASKVQRHSLKKRRQSSKQAVKMTAVVVVLFYICVIPSTLLDLERFINWTPSCAFRKVFKPMARFMYYSSCIVNLVICLSFVQSYRRGLRNILSPCRRMWNKMMAKREQITLKRRKTLPDENCQPTSKKTELKALDLEFYSLDK